MARTRTTSKIVSLITALLVLVGGFYIIVFLPTGLSLLARLVIGLLVILYFMLRMKMIFPGNNTKNHEIKTVRRWE